MGLLYTRQLWLAEPFVIVLAEMGIGLSPFRPLGAQFLVLQAVFSQGVVDRRFLTIKRLLMSRCGPCHELNPQRMSQENIVSRFQVFLSRSGNKNQRKYSQPKRTSGKRPMVVLNALFWQFQYDSYWLLIIKLIISQHPQVYNYRLTMIIISLSNSVSRIMKIKSGGKYLWLMFPVARSSLQRSQY